MVDLSFPEGDLTSSPLWRESQIRERLSQQLLTPAEDLFSRPKKAFRARLVQLGFQMAGGSMDAQSEPLLDIATDAIEQLHAGTLIIDDIQDDSAERRNAPSIHVKYGVPQAICVGNWLYFSPLRRLAELNLPWPQDRLMMRAYYEALEQGHYGQALDVGTDVLAIAGEEISSTCYACMELKTGTLTALALTIGAVIASDDPTLLTNLRAFGKKLGLALQCFDDLGNALGPDAHPKALEDIRHHRPGFIWAAAHELYGKVSLDQLRTCVQQLPDLAPVRAWFDQHHFYEQAMALANSHLESAKLCGIRAACSSLGDKSPTVESLIEEIVRDIAQSYIR